MSCFQPLWLSLILLSCLLSTSIYERSGTSTATRSIQLTKYVKYFKLKVIDKTHKCTFLSQPFIAVYAGFGDIQYLLHRLIRITFRYLQLPHSAHVTTVWQKSAGTRWACLHPRFIPMKMCGPLWSAKYNNGDPGPLINWSCLSSKNGKKIWASTITSYQTLIEC